MASDVVPPGGATAHSTAKPSRWPAASRLVLAARERRNSLAAMIADLEKEELQELREALEELALHPGRAAARLAVPGVVGFMDLLKVMLASRRTLHLAAVVALEAMQCEVLIASEAFHCLSELHLALRTWKELPYDSGEDSGESCESGLEVIVVGLHDLTERILCGILPSAFQVSFLAMDHREPGEDECGERDSSDGDVDEGSDDALAREALPKKMLGKGKGKQRGRPQKGKGKGKKQRGKSRRRGEWASSDEDEADSIQEGTDSEEEEEGPITAWDDLMDEEDDDFRPAPGKGRGKARAVPKENHSSLPARRPRQAARRELSKAQRDLLLDPHGLLPSRGESLILTARRPSTAGCQQLLDLIPTIGSSLGAVPNFDGTTSAETRRQEYCQQVLELLLGDEPWESASIGKILALIFELKQQQALVMGTDAMSRLEDKLIEASGQLGSEHIAQVLKVLLALIELDLSSNAGSYHTSSGDDWMSSEKAETAKSLLHCVTHHLLPRMEEADAPAVFYVIELALQYSSTLPLLFTVHASEAYLGTNLAKSNWRRFELPGAEAVEDAHSVYDFLMMISLAKLPKFKDRVFWKLSLVFLKKAVLIFRHEGSGSAEGESEENEEDEEVDGQASKVTGKRRASARKGKGAAKKRKVKGPTGSLSSMLKRQIIAYERVSTVVDDIHELVEIPAVELQAQTLVEFAFYLISCMCRYHCQHIVRARLARVVALSKKRQAAGSASSTLEEELRPFESASCEAMLRASAVDAVGTTSSTVTILSSFGQHLLVACFEHFPSCRRAVLAHCFQLMAEEAPGVLPSSTLLVGSQAAGTSTSTTPPVEGEDGRKKMKISLLAEGYCQVLECLAVLFLPQLCEFHSMIYEWIEDLLTIEFTLADRIQRAFLPLVAFSPPFLNSAIVLLRKHFHSAHRAERLLAARGFCTMFSNVGPIKGAQADIVVFLRQCFSLPIGERTQLYQYFRDSLRRTIAQSTLEPTARLRLIQLLLQRLGLFVTKEVPLPEPEKKKGKKKGKKKAKKRIAHFITIERLFECVGRITPFKVRLSLGRRQLESPDYSVVMREDINGILSNLFTLCLENNANESGASSSLAAGDEIDITPLIKDILSQLVKPSRVLNRPQTVREDADPEEETDWLNSTSPFIDPAIVTVFSRTELLLPLYETMIGVIPALPEKLVRKFAVSKNALVVCLMERLAVLVYVHHNEQFSRPNNSWDFYADHVDGTDLSWTVLFDLFSAAMETEPLPSPLALQLMVRFLHNKIEKHLVTPVILSGCNVEERLSSSSRVPSPQVFARVLETTCHLYAVLLDCQSQVEAAAAESEDLMPAPEEAQEADMDVDGEEGPTLSESARLFSPDVINADLLIDMPMHNDEKRLEHVVNAFVVADLHEGLRMSVLRLITTVIEKLVRSSPADSDPALLQTLMKMFEAPGADDLAAAPELGSDADEEELQRPAGSVDWIDVATQAALSLRAGMGTGLTKQSVTAYIAFLKACSAAFQARNKGVPKHAMLKRSSKIATVMMSILSEYSIKHYAVLREYLSYVLAHALPLQGLRYVTTMLEVMVRPEGSNDKYLIRETETCGNATAAAVLKALHALLLTVHKPHTGILFGSVEYHRDTNLLVKVLNAICFVLRHSEIHGRTMTLPRVRIAVQVMLSLFTTYCRLLSSKKPPQLIAALGRGQVEQERNVVEQLLRTMLLTCGATRQWIMEMKDTFPKKLGPELLFRLETSLLSISKVLEHIKSLPKSETLLTKAQLKSLYQCFEEQSVWRGPKNPQPKGPRKPSSRRSAKERHERQKRLRSRNKFIDEGLREENGVDSYADLEGFVVDGGNLSELLGGGMDVEEEFFPAGDEAEEDSEKEEENDSSGSCDSEEESTDSEGSDSSEGSGSEDSDEEEEEDSIDIDDSDDEEEEQPKRKRKRTITSV